MHRWHSHSRATHNWAAALILLSMIGAAFAQQPASDSNCHGLHAGISASRLGWSPENIMLGFVLLNDSNAALDAAPATWVIVVDGKVLDDSHRIFSQGPQPAGGYDRLESGKTFQLGKALAWKQYFPESRDYAVSWRGQGFESPTIKVHGGEQAKEMTGPPH